MKIFGKQGKEYIVKLTEDELLNIVFGTTYPIFDKSIDARGFLQRCDNTEVEIPIHKRFLRVMEVYNTKIKGNVDSVTSKLSKAIKLLTEFESLVETTKDYIDSTNNRIE